MKYHVVTGFNLESLVVNVNLFLQKGWSPLGGVAVAPSISPFLFCRRSLRSLAMPRYRHRTDMGVRGEDSVRHRKENQRHQARARKYRSWSKGSKRSCGVLGSLG